MNPHGQGYEELYGAIRRAAPWEEMVRPGMTVGVELRLRSCSDWNHSTAAQQCVQNAIADAVRDAGCATPPAPPPGAEPRTGPLLDGAASPCMHARIPPLHAPMIWAPLAAAAAMPRFLYLHSPITSLMRCLLDCFGALPCKGHSSLRYTRDHLHAWQESSPIGDQRPLHH